MFIPVRLFMLIHSSLCTSSSNKILFHHCWYIDIYINTACRDTQVVYTAHNWSIYVHKHQTSTKKNNNNSQIKMIRVCKICIEFHSIHFSLFLKFFTVSFTYTLFFWLKHHLPFQSLFHVYFLVWMLNQAYTTLYLHFKNIEGTLA